MCYASFFSLQCQETNYCTYTQIKDANRWKGEEGGKMDLDPWQVFTMYRLYTKFTAPLRFTRKGTTWKKKRKEKSRNHNLLKMWKVYYLSWTDYFKRKAKAVRQRNINGFILLYHNSNSYPHTEALFPCHEPIILELGGQQGYNSRPIGHRSPISIPWTNYPKNLSW